MTLEPIVFFALIIDIFILSLSLGAIVIYYTNTLRKLQALNNEKITTQKDLLKKSDLILEEAREKALKIISDANLFDDSTRKLFDQELKRIGEGQVKTLEKLSYDLLNIYQKELGELKDNNIKMVNIISKDIENSTVAELKDFKEILKKETFESQKIVEDKIEDAYKIAQKEIEDYKLERIKKVEGQIYEIIQNVSKIVLGKTLSLQEHEQLVIDALEKAKKEGTL
mgnify:CR=1 FL=1